jgi:hypothetical protein
MINLGQTTAQRPKMRLLMGTSRDSLFVEATRTLNRNIGPGQIDSILFPLPDFRGTRLLRIEIDPGDDILERNNNNNIIELTVQSNRARLSEVTDTLFSPDSNVAVRPARKSSPPITVSITAADTAGRDPARQGMTFAPLLHSGNSVYKIEAVPERDSLAELLFFIDRDSLNFLVPDTVFTYCGIYRWSPDFSRWVWQGGDLSGNTFSLTVGHFSEYCTGIRNDVSGPVIELSSKGRPFLFTDYIPIGYPIDIYVKDEAGVDSTTFQVTVNGKRQDSSHLRYDYSGGGIQLLLGNYLPDRSHGIDSLLVKVADVNGNYSEKKLAFILGEELSIKFLANYPNPFLEKTQIAFTVTDVCETASIKIFSIAGRLVRSWDLIDLIGKNIIGYQELEWDGTDNEGYTVGNGTYYVKLKVRGPGGTREKITPAVKLQGYKR